MGSPPQTIRPTFTECQSCVLPFGQERVLCARRDRWPCGPVRSPFKHLSRCARCHARCTLPPPLALEKSCKRHCESEGFLLVFKSLSQRQVMPRGPVPRGIDPIPQCSSAQAAELCVPKFFSLFFIMFFFLGVPVLVPVRASKPSVVPSQNSFFFGRQDKCWALCRSTWTEMRLTHTERRAEERTDPQTRRLQRHSLLKTRGLV